MNWVFISLVVLTVGQTAVCGLSWVLLLSYIGRGIFLSRLLGAVVPYKVSLGFEVADMFFVFLLGVVFTKTAIDWLGILLNLLFCTGAALLYLIDDHFYLYVVTDDEDEGE